MQATVFSKAQGGAVETFNGGRIVLDAPSVVQLQIGPESVARFERDGNDLVLLLKDGSVLRIQNFFVVTAEGRNDLVFEDANGVTWWAQYGEKWTGFDIAEINEAAAVAPFPPALLAGLGILAGGAALAFGGRNTPPTGEAEPVTTSEDTPVSGKVVGFDEDDDELTFSLKDGPDHGTVTVNEDGSYTYTPDQDYNGSDSFEVTVDDGRGGTTTVIVEVTVTPENDPPVGSADPLVTPEDTPASGQVEATDVDGDSLTYALKAGPSHGTLVLNPDGSYNYTPDPDYHGGDSFEVLVEDGNGGTTTVAVPITVTPVNDPATITGAASGAVGEAGGVANGTPGTPGASGTLTVSDVDAGEAVFQTPASLDGTYGTFTFDPATGAWTYTLDDSRTATQALTDGEVVTDQLVVTSHDGTAAETIEVTVTGANDVPVVTDSSSGVTEDDAVVSGMLSTSGQVTIVDVDAGESRFDAGSLTPSGTPLGSLTIDYSDGTWDYEVNNALSAVQALAEGETITETWTVTSADGTATGTIEVTITGTNDDPVVSGVSSGSVTEDGTLSVSGQLTETDVDTSDTHSWTVEGGSGDYGTLSVDGSGEWTYLLDNTNGDVQALGDGETLTETVTVRVTDNHGGYDEQVVTVTINGTNNAPVIASGGDVSGAVTEVADGAAGENITTHSQTGTLVMSDADASDTLDTLTVDVTPGNAGYKGDFSLSTNTTTGEIGWTFEVDDSDLDELGEGETLTQTYEVTVEDPGGATATETVTITLTGTNDQPEPEDDASLIRGGVDTSAALNVAANDADDDAGEAATLQVASVAGQAIAPGGSITLPGGVGTVALAADGQTLTFTPGVSAPNTVNLSYTVDDGSGTANATATADWQINIAGVDITDDASPAGATTPDNVLAEIDDLEHVKISGHAAPGGTVTSLVLTNGATTVTVPAGDITVNPDGSYTAEVDLSSGPDGTWTVAATIEDAGGNTVTVNDTILMDTVTPVSIDPVAITAGVAPTITGLGEPGAEVTLTIDGVDHTATVGSDGRWSVTLPAPLGDGDITMTAVAEDLYGNTDSVTRDVVGLVVTDQIAGEDEHIAVSETGLANGTDSTSGADKTSSTLVLGTFNSPLQGIHFGSTFVTAAQLGSATSGAPVDVSTLYGVLSITGYDSTTGVISYTYRITANTEDHSDASANDRIREDLEIAVVEADGDTRISTLSVAIEDDAPEVPVADTPVSVVEDGAAVGSANGGDNLLANDTLGADDGRVHQVSYTDRSGASQTVDIPEGGSETVDTQYGSLTVASDGTWSYTPVASAYHDQSSAHDTELNDNFSYTTIDGDGDVSAGSATQVIVVQDTVPVLGTPEDGTVDEQYLPNGSAPDATAPGLGASGSLNLTVGADDIVFALSGLNAITSGGDPLVYDFDAATGVLTGYKGSASGPAILTITLVDNATPPDAPSWGYEFDLLGPIDHGGQASLDLDFGVTVTDSDGDTTSASFTVTVTDDAPAGTLARTINEDSGEDTFTISADMTSANSFVSGATDLGGGAYKTAHGTVTIGDDGTVTYEPDANFSGVESFTITTTDDGVLATTVVTMTVTAVSDAPTLAVDAAQTNTLEDTAVALGLKVPVITDDGTGTGNNATPERIGAITLSGLPEGATLDWGGGVFTVPASGAVTIVLNDVPTEANATGDLTMSTSRFEAITVTPPAHDASNFTVTYSVDSFEVDAAGNKLAGVPEANSTTSVLVYVEAVTDDALLAFDTTVDASSVANADAIVYDPGAAEATVTLKEDAGVDISSILGTVFNDVDGSEARSFTITNNTGQTIMVNGAALADGGSVDVAAPGLSSLPLVFPTITVGGDENFSGDLDGITITLNAQDYDADGYLFDTAPGAAGVAEADTSDNSVTLNLRVTPVADDVDVEKATGQEDSPINFLAGVSLTDTSAAAALGGTEVIRKISFDVPAGWTVAAPSSVPAGVMATAGLSGSTYTITFTAGTQSDRELYLDGFTITPPAHQSADATIDLSISTIDTSVVGGTFVLAHKTETHSLDIEVSPVAEEIGQDTDGDGTSDLTMTPGMTYTTPANEDEWFAFDADLFNLKTGWTNQDSSEETFARLTPELLAGDGSSADAEGSMFRWTEDGGITFKQAIYAGTPIDVPVAYLDTLEFRAVDNFSGQFRIKVEAVTVDYDDDNGIGNGTPDTAVSGEQYLENVLIKPVADEVTLTLGARARGFEDTEIPLSIRPTSSDPSETFEVTISSIPAGAVVTYDGSVLVISAGSVVIADFSSSKTLTITPPPNSNEDFTLDVSARSVDELTVGGTTHTEHSAYESLQVDVEVIGVADMADVTALMPTYEEAALDAGSDKVMLSDLVTVALTDTDGSEVLTMQITGLPDGFAPTHGTLVSAPNVAPENRVWVLSTSQYAQAEITVPDNFSGKVDFLIGPVSTENDGASLTWAGHLVDFIVTPSPEAIVTTEAVVVEDVIQPIGLTIVHQNGDTDETLTAVRIEASQLENKDFTLFVGSNPLDGLVPVDDGGTEYYVLTPEQVAQLSAVGDAHLDGSLGSFEFQYQITDPSGDGLLSAVAGPWQDATFSLSATPVTDVPDLTLDHFALNNGSGIVEGNAVTVTTVGTDVTLNLNVATEDADGSEHLVRVIVEGVPDGVTVEGGELIAGGVWVVIYEGADAQSIAGGSLDLPLVFDVGYGGGTITDAPITVTVQTQDRGNDPAAVTDVLEDSFTWTLSTTFGAPGPGNPPSVDTWEYTGAAATEDTSFRLSEMIDAEVDAAGAAPSVLTVTITDLPPGTQVSGMILTNVGGVETWSASVTTEAGDTPAQVEAKLAALMDSIEITSPQDSNDNNNAANPLTFNAALTAALVAGGPSDSKTITPDIPVAPVTDPANFTVALGAADADGKLTENDTEVPISITVTNPADGANGSIVDGKLYLQIGGDAGLDTGDLTLGGTPVTAQAVSGVPGLPDGTYYVIDGVSMGDTIDMVYTPDTMLAGTVTVDAWVRNEETGAADALTSTGSTNLLVERVNDGVTLSPDGASGLEWDDFQTTSLIELPLALQLADDDGSEEILSVLLSNLPEGFLVFVGDNASTAALATNAGGAGGFNTWVLAGDGETMPAYVGILPPKNWSGTLAGLELLVTSGETALSETRVDTLPVGDVTVDAVANGIVLTPTNTFGTEGDIVPLNLNAAMADFRQVSASDESYETVTLTLTGLGEHAAFYIGTTILTSGITFDGDNGTYTLTGLSQTDLDNLGFRQAAGALTDQNAGVSGLQIGVTAYTVETDGGDESASETSQVTVKITPQLATSGDDTLIWTGAAINGRGGDDTVALRYGESLTGTELSDQLSNIETLDMGIEGANEIFDLTPEQVRAMTDGGDSLTITGTVDDSVSLSGDWADNGDGSYTGTIGGSSVTLIVENAGVTMPLSGFSAGMMSFSLFGLSALDGVPDEGEAAPSEGDPVGYDDLFASGAPEEDLTAGLPEEDTGAPAASDGTGDGSAATEWGGADPGPALEDELQSGVVYEV